MREPALPKFLWSPGRCREAGWYWAKVPLGPPLNLSWLVGSGRAQFSEDQLPVRQAETGNVKTCICLSLVDYFQMEGQGWRHVIVSGTVSAVIIGLDLAHIIE